MSVIDQHALQVLEYPKIRDRLAAHTSNAVGRDFALELEPLPYPETVVRRLQETREARWLRDTTSGLPLGGIFDIREAVERARLQVRLTGKELVDIRATIVAAHRLRAFLLDRREHVPLLAEMAANLPVFPQMDSRIEAALTETGEVRDSASPELARIRSQLKVTQNRLMDRLQSILTSERYRPFLQDSIITLREGRYCLPVKAEYARAFGGIVHDTSQSGATVFIEPEATIALGNELKQLSLEEEHEVDRILRELSRMVGDRYAELQRMISILGHLDLIHAKAILAEEMRAMEPVLNRRGVVKLRKARHPLLTGNVVPIDFEIGERCTVVLITGPNTGGKTVTLKTIGLLTLMTLAGLQIPAEEGTEIALFEQVFADIGDEQDIQQNLSTFSAHLKNIVHILENLVSNSLVLLDEIGAGTDPAEGAALAKAILEYLREREVRVVATTHYGELKEYAFSQPGVENASVEFDRETLSPTYRVLQGVPGSSHAFTIAARLGLPEEILQQARSSLSRKEVEASQLIEQLEQSRRNAAIAEQAALAARGEAERARAEYQERVRQIAEVQRTVRQQAQEEARRILSHASEKAENILKELQRMNRGARKGASARQKLKALREETYSALEPAPMEPPEPAPTHHVYRRGDWVRIPALHLEAQVLEEPKNGEVVVQMGAMRATFPVDQLRPLEKAPIIPSSSASRATSSASEIALRKALQISPELTLLAMRVDEALSLLERYLDDAYAAGLSKVRIIHGKGTGALRRAVQQFLADHPLVASYRLGTAEEGGDGVTIVELKG